MALDTKFKPVFGSQAVCRGLLGYTPTRGVSKYIQVTRYGWLVLLEVTLVFNGNLGWVTNLQNRARSFVLKHRLSSQMLNDVILIPPSTVEPIPIHLLIPIRCIGDPPHG